MNNNIMYQAELFSIGRERYAELDYKAYFTSKQKAVDWCREKLPLFHDAIEAEKNADYYISIREWVESEGRYMPNAFYEFISWNMDTQAVEQMHGDALNFFITL